MIECYIKGRNLIDGIEERFNVADGCVFIDNDNETLDSGTLIIPQLDHKIEIEPFDIVRISSKTGSKYQINSRYLCVDTFTCTQTCLNPARYKYEISLFSETKGLEGILCPSLSITALKNGRRTVKHYLEQYLNEYSPKITSSATLGAFGNKYVYGRNIMDGTESWTTRFDVECPEMQWNQPTLREVITDLMMVCDCIPCVINNTIHYIDISHEGEEISNTQKRGINFITESHSSADYVSELKMQITNSTDSKDPTFSYENEEGLQIPDGTSKISECIGFRNEGVYILNTDSLKLETSYPIWKIHKLAMVIDVTVDIDVYTHSEGGGLVHVDSFEDLHYVFDPDLTFALLEYGEWQTKPIYYDPNPVAPLPSLSPNYQNTCLFYKRGARGIENFTDKYNYIGGFAIPSQRTVWELAQDHCVAEAKFTPEIETKFLAEHPEYDDPRYSLTVSNRTAKNGEYWQAKFICVYEPVCDLTFSASKEPSVRNRRQVVDNQTASYVDVDRQGALEYLKAKRLGNKIALVNARYVGVDESALPKLGDKINGKIIFKRELSFKENYINANFTTVDNYVLRDYFTGVKSKIRSWKILSGDEAFVRSDTIKFYVNENIQPVNNEYRKIPVYDSPLEYLMDFRYCAIRFNTQSEGYLPNPAVNTHDGTNYGIDTYVVEFSKRKVGKSAVFSVKMLDNAILGRYVSKVHGNGGMEQQNCVYVDSNGENIGGTIWFFKDYNPQVPNAYGVTDYDAVSTALKPGANFSQISGIVAKIPFSFKKDNKEITQINIQFEINENANDLFLGKK